MTDTRKYSAAEESTGRFPAHGRVSLEICDNIARYEAWLHSTLAKPEPADKKDHVNEQMVFFHMLG